MTARAHRKITRGDVVELLGSGAPADPHVRELLLKMQVELARDEEIATTEPWETILEEVLRDAPHIEEHLWSAEKVIGRSYPLTVSEVVKLLQAARVPVDLNGSSIRRLSDVGLNLRIGSGNYRIFFARHVLLLALLRLRSWSPNEVAVLQRHAAGKWTEQERLVIDALADLRRSQETFSGGATDSDEPWWTRESRVVALNCEQDLELAQLTEEGRRLLVMPLTLIAAKPLATWQMVASLCSASLHDHLLSARYLAFGGHPRASVSLLRPASEFVVRLWYIHHNRNEVAHWIEDGELPSAAHMIERLLSQEDEVFTELGKLRRVLNTLVTQDPVARALHELKTHGAYDFSLAPTSDMNLIASTAYGILMLETWALEALALMAHIDDHGWQRSVEEHRSRVQVLRHARESAAVPTLDALTKQAAVN